MERRDAEEKRWEEEKLKEESEALRLQEEAEKISNNEETGFLETNSEREDRESADKWQWHLEKKEQELQDLDADMKKRPHKNDEY